MTVNKIHQSAIVSSKSELNGVTVGAFCLIEDNVRIEAGSYIGTGSIIKKGTHIGEKNHIGEQVLIGGDPQDLNFNPKLKTGVFIGDNNTIREKVTIHRATVEGQQTIIGNGCFLMGVSHYAHDVCLGDRVIVANNSLLAGHVQVGDQVFISGNCAIHQFVKIGRQAMIAGLSKVPQDVPPYCLAEGYPVLYKGLNVVGLRRAGFTLAQRKLIKKIYRELYSYRANLGEKLKAMKQKSLSLIEKEVVDFFLYSKRGVIKNK